MPIDPQAIQDAINNAGSLLMQRWKQPGGAMPENDLHPDASALQFRINLLEQKYATLENVVGQCVRAIKALQDG